MEVVLLQAVFPHVQQGAHRQVPKCKGLALQQLQPGQELLRKPNEKFLYVLQVNTYCTGMSLKKD